MEVVQSELAVLVINISFYTISECLDRDNFGNEFNGGVEQRYPVDIKGSC